MPGKHSDYGAADFAGEGEVFAVFHAMKDDDQRVQKKERQRDDEDEDYVCSSQESAYSEYSQNSSQNSSQCAHSSQASQSSQDYDDINEFNGTSQYSHHTEGYDSDATMGSSDTFPQAKLCGGTLRRIALARHAWRENNGGNVGALLAVLRAFTNLDREEMCVAYRMVRDDEEFKTVASVNALSDDTIREHAWARWDEHLRKERGNSDLYDW